MIEYKTALPTQLKKKEFAPLLLPILRDQTLRTLNPQFLFIDTAWDGTRLVGLLVAQVLPALLHAQLLSLMVQETSRHKGIGSALLKRFMTHASAKQISLVSTVYEETDANALYFQKMLAAQGWEPSVTQAIRYFFHLPSFNPYWFQHPPQLPSSYKILPWTKLSQKELSDLKKQEERHVFSPLVSPFTDPGRIEPLTSLALKHQDEIVGWIMTHHLSPHLLRYSAFYIQPQFRNLEGTVALLAEAIRRHKNSPILWGQLENNLSFSSLSWIKFLRKRLEVHAHMIQEIKTSYKKIN